MTNRQVVEEMVSAVTANVPGCRVNVTGLENACAVIGRGERCVAMMYSTYHAYVSVQRGNESPSSAILSTERVSEAMSPFRAICAAIQALEGN